MCAPITTARAAGIPIKTRRVLQRLQPLCARHAATIGIAAAAYAEGGTDLLRLLDWNTRTRLDAELGKGMVEYRQSIARLEAAEESFNENVFYCFRAGFIFMCARYSPCPRAQSQSQHGSREQRDQGPKDRLRSPDQVAQRAVRRKRRPYREPELLRVKGQIALADDRTWRVGVRTLGSVISVYAGLGDYVHKGQILARYHADEVRDSRAQYRAALSDLDRAKTAEAQAQRNLNRAQRLLEHSRFRPTGGACTAGSGHRASRH